MWWQLSIYVDKKNEFDKRNEKNINKYIPTYLKKYIFTLKNFSKEFFQTT